MGDRWGDATSEPVAIRRPDSPSKTENDLADLFCKILEKNVLDSAMLNDAWNARVNVQSGKLSCAPAQLLS